ncbi:PEGA domain-containing protein [Vreelandella rituensis]|uniref:PEGA domain-containing protein n=1 Tax=Vreelandella rituensis TaxID=2282306 RepID=A0A368U907_9GAMM|nr:PEGA domain-containing protein [Halomonas rituensis]RCV92986.1 PEGA domain-containing protein [Halomonas rituensis]
MKMLKIAAAVSSLAIMTGCASIVGEKEQTVTINSTPSNAEVMITDERSLQVHSGQTPTTVQLKKSDGSYFGGKSYTVEISKNGYESRTMMINATPNGWYIGGNLIFGGLIGWLIVDPLTGSMYNLSPDTLNTTLGESVATSDQGNSEITLVLLEDVPAEFKEDMQYIGKI